MSFLNIAAYKFTPFEGDLKPLRERLRAQCDALGLRGTILLSREGINLFIAGTPSGIAAALSELRALPGLNDLVVKESWSESQPFRRMLVRIKKEIIAFGVGGIDPARRPSPKLQPRQLKQWLDEGRPVTLLDTRNDYEVKLGTFRGAVVPPIASFREFPDAVARLPAALKDRPIVMFCTGGIRCEKAGPFMQREGFREVYQLDGGILKYFEDVGADHFEGECFVFDQRVGVNPALEETPTTQCFRCQAPLSAEEQASPLYVPGHRCPHCHREPAEAMAESITRRHEALHRAITPLPGSVPYDSYRPMTVPAAFDGARLIEFLTGCFAHAPAERWRALLARGALVGPNDDATPVTADLIVHAGERYREFLSQSTEPPVNAAIRILHEDEAIVVIDKPAPLPMHPGGRFNRNTLQHLLRLVYAPQKPRPAHRLDANTSGVLVVSRTRHVASRLQPQFERQEVEKWYLVRVHGHPVDDQFACTARITAEPDALGARGIAGPESDGDDAHTDFTVLCRDSGGTALVEARPRTGRTNQIRLHLQHLGHPVVGDPVYTSAPSAATTQTLAPVDPPLCLHSWKLRFTHPTRGNRVTFEADPPAWAKQQSGS